MTASVVPANLAFLDETPYSDAFGDVYHSAGDAMAAQRAWGRALRIFKEIEHPGAERIGTRMSGSADLLV